MTTSKDVFQMFSSTTTPKRLAAGVATAALLVFPLSACQSSNADEAGSSSAPKAVAVVESISGDTTAIKLDKGFTDALTSLKLTPGVTGTAKLTDGSLVFPITGGNVTVFKPGEVSPYVVGQVQHEGSGLSLAAGDTTVELTNLNVDPTISKVYGDVTVNGEVAATSVHLFELDGRTLKPLQTKGSKAILEGTKVMISGTAAPLLNKTFNTDAVKTGLLVGIAKITVETK
jgi:hypothetical protein